MQRFVKLSVLICSLVFSLAAPGRAQLAGSYQTTPEGNAKYLADYAALPDVKKLPGGLMYRVIQPGNGKGTSPLGRQDIVTVQYRGWLIDGNVFDRTKPGEPHSFATGNLIVGWSEALYKMKTGEMWQIVIPARLGYGDAGRPPVIPPGQTLVFLVKLEKVEYP